MYGHAFRVCREGGCNSSGGNYEYSTAFQRVYSQCAALLIRSFQLAEACVEQTQQLWPLESVQQLFSLNVVFEGRKVTSPTHLESLPIDR